MNNGVIVDAGIWHIHIHYHIISCNDINFAKKKLHKVNHQEPICRKFTSFLHTVYLKSVLTFQFSDEGSNQVPAEKQAYINFVDFLDECEG